jgi:hypothetical protein
VLLAINEVDWQDDTVLANWAGKGPISVSVSNPAVNNAAPGFNTLSVQWNIGPVVSVAGKWQYPVTKIVVSFIVIYQP